jgi:hypothetical protein
MSIATIMLSTADHLAILQAHLRHCAQGQGHHPYPPFRCVYRPLYLCRQQLAEVLVELTDRIGIGTE